MADKRCENGHFIDESWDLCPYCPVDENEAEMPIVRPTRFGGADAAKPAPVEPEPPPRRPVAVPPPPPLRRETSAAAVQAPPLERTVAVQRNSDATPKRYVVGWLIGLNGAARGEAYSVRIGSHKFLFMPLCDEGFFWDDEGALR